MVCRLPTLELLVLLVFATAWQGYPANPDLTRWSTLPYETNLYLEQLTPGGALFEEMQMWWEDLPSHPNLTFVRWDSEGGLVNAPVCESTAW